MVDKMFYGVADVMIRTWICAQRGLLTSSLPWLEDYVHTLSDPALDSDACLLNSVILRSEGELS